MTFVAVDREREYESGIVLADDLEPDRAVESWVALLPALDPPTMGWKRREWYLGEHASALFDRNGNAGPTVWSGDMLVTSRFPTPLERQLLQ